MITQDQLRSVIGTEAYDTEGNKIGKVGQVFLDDQTGEPEFATVKTGLFAGKETFIPLAQASFDSGHLNVPFTKNSVKDAPRIDVDEGHLTQEQEAELYRYYGLDYSHRQSDSGLAGGGMAGEGMAGGTAGTMEPGTSMPGRTGRHEVGEMPLESDTSLGRDRDMMGDRDLMRDPDTMGERDMMRDRDMTHDRDLLDDDTRAGTMRGDTARTPDDAMTRSEEELQVGRERRAVGRARLRKYVVTEQQEQTVPVSHEEVRVEREPITDANRDRAMTGPDLTDSEHEVTLHEEVPVTEKRTVPKERVRLDKDVVADEENVSGDVRKERIDMEGDTER